MRQELDPAIKKIPERTLPETCWNDRSDSMASS